MMYVCNPAKISIMSELVIEKGFQTPREKSNSSKELALEIYTKFEINDSTFITQNIGYIMKELERLSRINESKIKFQKITAQKDNIWGYRLWRIQ